MFSKRGFFNVLQVLIAMSLLWTTSCTRFLDEKRETPQSIEMSNARFACLQALPEEITKYTKGAVNNADIRSGFQCAQDALIYFKNKTIGTYDDEYTIEDLRNFFGKYFLKKNNVTPEFGAELLKMKQFLLGGSEKTITKAELQRLVEFLNVVRDQAILLAPYVPTLLAEGQNPTWDGVDKATAQLEISVWALFKQVDVANSKYSFDDFKKFMEGLDKFINASEPFMLAEKMGSNLALIEAAKYVLIGEQYALKNVNDWQVAIDTVVSVYREGLRFIYFLKDHEVNNPEQARYLVRIFDDALMLLAQSLPVQTKGGISFASIDNVFDALEARNLLPLGVSARGYKETYKKVILRMLSPERRGDARGLTALELSHIVALRHEIKAYELHQAFIDSLNFKSNGVGFGDIKSAAQAFDVNSIIEKDLSRDTLEQEALRTAWAEGLSMLVRDYPIVYNHESRQIVTGTTATLSPSWGSLTRWNVMRALTRAMLLGYGSKHTSSVAQEEILVSGLEQWYTDFNTLGIELKAFDPRSVNSGKRSFNEANFFSSAGNGDDVMNYRETFDFISLLVAGGMSSAESIRKDLNAQGCGLPEADIFGFPWLSETCVGTTLRKNFAAYFDNLPGMVTEVAAMNDAQWKDFFTNLMTAARTSPADGGKVETGDLRTAVMILHYTESLMSVYDTNRDGKLNTNEIRAAAPRFLTFMKTVSPVKSNFLVTDFFLFLVYRGQKPTLVEYAKFQAEKAFGSLPDAGRDKILRVFKVLKDEANKK